MMTNSIIGLEPETGSPATTSGDLIKDTTTATFMADVVEASNQVPVLVDFWAPWCGPCKQLGPTIEKAVTEAGGAVKLVKINVDENQEIAQQMRVQSIPAVFAFVGGQPIDGFMGAKSESEVKAFIDKVLNAGGGAENTQVAELLEQAETALEADDVGQAAQIFSAIMQAEPKNIAAITGLARCQVAADDLEAAAKTLSLIPEEEKQNPEVTRVKAALQLAENPVDESEFTRLEERVKSSPEDFQARFDFANLLNNVGSRQEALDHLLHIISQNRDWNDQAARKQVLTFFESWGPSDENTIAGRKKLSSILFS
jgi:putative thioredoxin